MPGCDEYAAEVLFGVGWHCWCEEVRQYLLLDLGGEGVECCSGLRWGWSLLSDTVAMFAASGGLRRLGSSRADAFREQSGCKV